MIRRFILAAALLVLAGPAIAALPVGATAPDFTTQATLAGKPFSFRLADALKKGPVVLYFFPAAFTSGCTVEAHEFAEATADFNKMGATVIGVAADPIDKLNKFSVEACRSKFAVAVATKPMIKGYDVALPLIARSNRTSFVIAPNRRIAYVYSAMSAQGHVANTLDAVRKLKAGK
jgi:thioredoxin-dependent peroxiredoxin